MKSWSFAIAIMCLLATMGLMNSLSHGEMIVAKKPFLQFPLRIAGRWVGEELGLEKEVLDKLRVSDYMMRMYLPLESLQGENIQDGATPVSLYVGYYQSQRTGATYHSPKNCLPGAGWQFSESGTFSVPLDSGETMTINKVIIQKGIEKQVILYWYHDRGRIIASEYWAKAWMIWDAMTENRTDGALVRISVPVLTNTDQATDLGLSFLHDMWDDLLGHMPAKFSHDV
jgi:EpsI family protein